MKRFEPYPLWLGNAGDARDLTAIIDTDIEVLVQLAVEEPAVPLPRGLVLLRIPIHDGLGNPSRNLRLAIGNIADLIQQRRPTLVCCSAGLSRTPGVVAVALAIAENKDPATCLRAIGAALPTDVSPGLWQELLGVHASFVRGK